MTCWRGGTSRSRCSSRASRYLFVKIGWGVVGLAIVAVFGTLLSDLILVALSRKLCPEIRIQRRLMSRAYRA